MANIIVLLTCFNRADKTVDSINTLWNSNPKTKLTFVVVDDGSTDETLQALHVLSNKIPIKVVETKGNKYYSGGMRIGMKYILKNFKMKFDYLLMINDDVSFFEAVIEDLIDCNQKAGNNSVIVGSTRDHNGRLTYSGIKYTKGLHYRKLYPAHELQLADTFNANCVLIPEKLFRKTGPIDSHYVHGLGDFDYGFGLREAGAKIFVAPEFVGICESNTVDGSWADTSLDTKTRFRLLQSTKGSPSSQWFYFVNKHFGLCKACVATITPMIRILLKK